MVKSRRIERQVRIQEKNNPPSELFDITKIYASTDLPEWFAGLQSILEDETFTSMEINLGNRVHYLLSIVGPVQSEQQETKHE